MREAFRPIPGCNENAEGAEDLPRALRALRASA